MPQLTNPEDALRAFQRALDARSISTRPASTDPSLHVHMDFPDGVVPRITYAELEDSKVAALVVVVPAEPIEHGVLCFGIGYAVHPRFRGQGRASRIVERALGEFRHGMHGRGVHDFYVEAIVGVTNVASQRVASKTLSTEGREGIDAPSGKAILAYAKRFERA